MSYHKKSFPNESSEYREYRNKLLESEIELRSQVEKLGEMRKKLPLGGSLKMDYEFETQQGTVKLSSLFEGGKSTLAIYSFMYGPQDEAPCPSCTSILDGLNGSARHIKDRMNLAIVAKSPIARISKYADIRGWTDLDFLSSGSNSYNTDYFAENAQGAQIPALNIFKKTEKGIYHFYNTELLYAELKGHPRHVDSLWPIWNLFDMTPEGRGENWFPKLDY